MNYGERELTNNRLSQIEKRLNNPREITFLLNDYTEQSDKNYYFCFEVNISGCVKIEVQKGNYNKLTLNGVNVLCGEYFFLEKGVYEILLQTTVENTNQAVKVSVFGDVSYHDNSQVKVLSGLNYSIIALICAGQLSIYYYDGNIALIDKIETEDYDMALDRELTVYYLSQSGIEKKEYIYPFNAGVITSYPIDGVTGIKYSQDGLYLVKSGKLFLANIEDEIQLSECGIELKDIFAVKQNKVIYRDYNGKIKLSDFSVSPRN